MKKNRADSIAEQLRIVTTPAVVPPSHIEITKGEKPFWTAIIAARGATLWTQVDLCHAATLATCMYDIYRLQKKMRREKDYISNSVTGGTKLHPGHQLIDVLVKRSIVLSKMLHVHASATLGRPRDTGARTSKEQELRDGLPQSGLLAKPLVQH